MRILPPDKAKMQARANVAAWKREKALKVAEGIIDSDMSGLQAPIEERPIKEQELLNKDLLEAVKNGKIESIGELIDKGADVNVKDNRGCTAIIWAAIGCGKETLQLLVEKGAEMEARDIYGATALIFASNSGNIAAVDFLVRNGADVNALARYRGLEWTALSVASAQGHKEVVKLLRRYGAK